MSTVTSAPLVDLEQGTVIDHIPAGKAFLILRMLKLEDHKKHAFMGINLPSNKIRLKDIIKVEGWELSENETTQIAIFAPDATVNIIQNSSVISKYTVKIPPTIAHCIICPNANCITNHEKTSHLFHIDSDRKMIQLRCHFCEKTFSKHEITQYFP